MVNAKKFEKVRSRVDKGEPGRLYKLLHIGYLMRLKKENEMEKELTRTFNDSAELENQPLTSIVTSQVINRIRLIAIASCRGEGFEAIRNETIARAEENAYAKKLEDKIVNRLEGKIVNRELERAVLATVNALRFEGTDGKEAAGRRLETIRKVAANHIPISWKNMIFLSELDRYLSETSGANRLKVVVDELCRLGNLDIHAGYTVWDATVAIANRHDVTIDQIEAELMVRNAFFPCIAKK